MYCVKGGSSVEGWDWDCEKGDWKGWWYGFESKVKGVGVVRVSEVRMGRCWSSRKGNEGGWVGVCWFGEMIGVSERGSGRG